MSDQDRLARYQFIEGLARQRRVLEIGCGSGRGAAMLANLARSVVSVDADGHALALARSEFPHCGLSHVVARAPRFPWAAETFDLVVTTNLWSWREDLAAVIHEVRRVLRADGHAVFAVGEGEGEFLSLDDLDEEVRRTFQHVRLFGQIPFVGSILADLAPDEEPEPALDCTLVQEDEEPTHYLAICAGRPIEPLPYTVVQQPKLESDERALLEELLARAEQAERLADETGWSTDELRQRAEKAEQRNDVLFARVEQGETERSQLRHRIAEIQALGQADQWRVDELTGLLAQRDATDQHPTIAGRFIGASLPATVSNADPQQQGDDASEVDALRAQIARLQSQLALATSAVSELEQLRLQVRAEKRESAGVGSEPEDREQPASID